MATSILWTMMIDIFMENTAQHLAEIGANRVFMGF
jgi:hypothetical protein